MTNSCWKIVRNKIASYILLLMYTIFSRMPWKVNLFVGSLLGKIFYNFDFRYKYIAFKNLRLVYPKKSFREIVKITKQCYTNLGKNLFEFFLFKRMKFIIHKIVDFGIEEYNLLKKMYSKKSGVVIFSAHYGNWELLGATFALHNFPLAVIARNIYIPSINFLVRKLRTAVNEIVIERKQTESIKYLFKAIKSGYLIGVLIDQNIQNIKNVISPFLGIPTTTPVSVVELVIKQKIPAVIGLLYRKADNRHKVFIKPLDESLYRDKMKLVSEINETISEMINLYPSQWVWIHNRWNLQNNEIKN